MADSNSQPVRELLRFLSSWEMLVVQGLSMSIVGLSPDDVLTRYSVLATFVHWLGTWIRPVVHYQQLSQFPQITGVYFSIMFLVTPIILFYSPKMKRLVFRYGEAGFIERPIRFCVGAIMLCLFCILSIPFFYIWNRAEDEFFPFLHIGSSKFSLAIVGWVAAGGGAWVIISHTIWFPIFAVLKICRKKGNKYDS